MKLKTIVGILVMACALSACSFYEGYTSEDGARLKDFEKPEALRSLTEKPDQNIAIIDVRPAKAYAKGHIPTAQSFPASEIMNRLNELPVDRSYILYCETGIRAQLVIRKLEAKGYTRLMNFGGYTRWPFPLVK